MNLLSEPVDAGDASAGSVPPPVPDDPEARQLLERLESRLGEFGDRLMTLQRTVEKDAPEVVDAQVIPPLDTDPPVAGPPLRDDDDAPTADLFRRFQAAAAVRDGTTREAGAPSRGLDRSVRRAVLVLVVILASTLAGVLILGLS
jgi:hypothetical protein